MFVSRKPLYIALFVLFGLYAFPASGQDHSTLSPPLPGQAPRGAYSRGDYYVPDDLLPALRANYVLVSTGNDEDEDCNPSFGNGISLREALEYCLAAAGYEGLTIYVPAGTYSISSEIQIPAFNFTLVGEDPLTTIVQASGSTRSFAWLPGNAHGVIANLTIRNSVGCCGPGGAIFVNGTGSLTLDNVILRENSTTSAAGGSGIYVTDVNPGPGHIDLTIRQSTLTENTTPGPGGGVAFLIDNNGSGTLSIVDSVISNNTGEDDGSCPTGSGGGGVSVRTGGPRTVSVTLDNVLLQGNEVQCAIASGGGLLAYATGGGPVILNASNSEFSGGGGQSLQGGGIAIHDVNGTYRLTNVYVHGNTADFGGGIYVADSRLVNLVGSTVSENTAGSGGGLYFESVWSAVVDGSIIANNISTGSYGGAVFVAENILIANSRITGNSALSQGGGLGIVEDGSFGRNGATLINTLIEDNTAAVSPECFNLDSDWVESLGGVGITDTSGCDFFPHPTDQFDNLVLNGGFEVQGVNAATPDGWKRANITGDRRKCNGDKPVTRYGNCAYVFVGGPGEASTLSQNVSTLGFADGETLRLYAQGEGGAATKATVVVKAVYSDPIPASKAKLTFKGLSDIGNFLSKDLVLIDGTLSQLQVKVTNTASSGKFTIDRVYLFSVSMFGRLNSGDVLPPPAAPSGFRGGN